MTAPSPTSVAARPTVAPTTVPTRGRRWHRAVVPSALLLALYLITGVAHAVQEPDLGEQGTLSPQGTGADGSSQLAGLLNANQVTVRTVTSSAQARSALKDTYGTPTTLFVPAPGFLDRRFLNRVVREHPGTRIVLVRPDASTAYRAGFLTGRSRWAARTVAPDCARDLAVGAGPATVLRSRYVADPQADVEFGSPAGFTCYDGGLVTVNSGSTEFVAVGATDPFRNSRIGEAGNRSLAVGLLSVHRQVIWVDLHRAEPGPPVPPPPDLPDPGYRQPDRSASGSSLVWGAFPPALWASLALLGLLAVLVAVVRGRRLGPPVAEPLPVVVPATEIVVGWGRLYQRSRSRAATLDALRSAAIRRMTSRLDPTGAAPDSHDDALVTAVAARLNLPVEQVRAILHPDPPVKDNDLASAVARLDALATAVEHSAAVEFNTAVEYGAANQAAGGQPTLRSALPVHDGGKP